MTTSNVIYRDGLFRLDVPFQLASAISDPINCNNLYDPTLEVGQQSRGSSSPIALIIPGNWITAAINFEIFSDDTFTSDPITLTLGDMANTPVSITNVSFLQQIPLDANIFAGVKFFKIRSSVVQPLEPIITLILFPLEQVYR